MGNMTGSKRSFKAGGSIIGMVVAIICLAAMPARVQAETCENVVQQLNQGLSPRIDEQELVGIIRNLNSSNRLPDKFVTKGQATRMGWRPGKNLWSSAMLKGKSIGGDRFGNREGRLP